MKFYLFPLMILIIIELSMSCFEPKIAMNYCIKLNNFPEYDWTLKGYDFGFGSIEDLENMCKTKWHIVIVKCMQKISQQNCSYSDETKFQKVVWEFTLSSDRYEKAAEYICKEFNLNIFEQYKINCFQKNEKSAEICSIKRKEASDEGIQFLTLNSTINKNQAYHINVQNVLIIYECLGLKNKLNCLQEVLAKDCAPNAVELLINYFRETLPSNCNYKKLDSKIIQNKNHQSDAEITNSQPQISSINEFKLSSTTMIHDPLILLMAISFLLLLSCNIY